jgi:hypothetical protein
MDKVAALEKAAKETKDEVDRLEAGVALCKKRIDIANVLVAGLKGEKENWRESLSKLR